MRHPHNGHATTPTDNFTDCVAGEPGVRQAFSRNGPLANVGGAEHVIYILTSLMIGLLFAYLWVHFSEEGSKL